MRWLKDFDPEQACAFAAVCMIVLMLVWGLAAIFLWCVS